MKLIWLFISSVFFVNCEYCDNFKFFSEDTTAAINGHYSCACINIKPFSGYFYLHITATVKNGYFYYKLLPYGDFPIQPINETRYRLTNSKYYDEEETGKANGKIYDYHILHYYIKSEKLNDYLVISKPLFQGDYVEIKIESYGISLFGVIGLIIALIVFVLGMTFLIGYCKDRRRRRRRNNMPLLNQNQVNLALNESPLNEPQLNEPPLIQEENHEPDRISSIN